MAVERSAPQIENVIAPIRQTFAVFISSKKETKHKFIKHDIANNIKIIANNVAKVN